MLSLLTALENTYAWLYPQTTQHHWRSIRFALYRPSGWNSCCRFLFCLPITPISCQFRGLIPDTDGRTAGVDCAARDLYTDMDILCKAELFILDPGIDTWMLILNKFLYELILHK